MKTMLTEKGVRTKSPGQPAASARKERNRVAKLQEDAKEAAQRGITVQELQTERQRAGERILSESGRQRSWTPAPSSPKGPPPALPQPLHLPPPPGMSRRPQNDWDW